MPVEDREKYPRPLKTPCKNAYLSVLSVTRDANISFLADVIIDNETPSSTK